MYAVSLKWLMFIEMPRINDLAVDSVFLDSFVTAPLLSVL